MSGVFSFDGKRLSNYIAYVECQKEHHAQNTTISVLERTDDAGVKVIREIRKAYVSKNWNGGVICSLIEIVIAR